MTDNDIEKINQILQYKGRDNLSELISKSKSMIRASSSYGSKLNSILSTFEIYSTIEYTEKLRDLDKEEQDLILNAVKEIYPVKEASPEIVDVKYYTTSSKENNDLDSIFSFWANIHPNITKVSRQLFSDEHYAEAAFSAFKEVNIRVKNIVRIKIGEELDGKTLMLKAFNLKHPIIQLSNCSTETEKNIQEGYMHLFAGAIQGIRNPKAHENITIDENRSIHFLYLASLLMNKLDELNQ